MSNYGLTPIPQTPLPNGRRPNKWARVTVDKWIELTLLSITVIITSLLLSQGRDNIIATNDAIKIAKEANRLAKEAIKSQHINDSINRNFAKKNIDIAQSSMEVANRAYISISFDSLGDDITIDNIPVYLSFKNIGSTPAKKCAFGVVCQFCRGNCPETMGAWSYPGINITIAANKSHKINNITHVLYDENDIVNWRNNRTYLRVFATVEYFDVFNVHHSCHAAFIIDAKKNVDDSVINWNECN